MDPITFGLNLHHEFINAHALQLAKIKKNREECYFRALISAFSSVGEAFAKEVHGRGHLVEFPPTGAWGSCCEIADIALVSFSSNPVREIRLGFIQAKLVRGHINGQSLPAAIHQWDLLHHRPVINRFVKNRPQKFPLNILSGSLLRSIGSFLFFSDQTLDEALYAPADQLFAANVYSNNRAKLRITNQPSQFRSQSGFCEILRTDTILDLGIATKLMLIGSPVVKGNVRHPDAFNWIKNFISSLHDTNNNEVLTEFKDLLGQFDEINVSNIETISPQSGGARSIAIVKGNPLG